LGLLFGFFRSNSISLIDSNYCFINLFITISLLTIHYLFNLNHLRSKKTLKKGVLITSSKADIMYYSICSFGISLVRLFYPARLNNLSFTTYIIRFYLTIYL